MLLQIFFKPFVYTVYALFHFCSISLAGTIQKASDFGMSADSAKRWSENYLLLYW